MVSQQLQKRINDFLRKYADKSYKLDTNTIKLSGFSDKKEDIRKHYDHNKRLAEVCMTLYHQGILFLTEFKMKGSLRPDIVCPTHTIKVFEIMHSETEEDFMIKKYRKYEKLGFKKSDIKLIRTYDKLTLDSIR